MGANLELFSLWEGNLTVGDIVLIADATEKSGIVRTVQIQTKTNVIERPVTKLCLLLTQGI